MFAKAKDTALSGMLRLIANKFAIERYGRMESFALDSKDKTLKLLLSLKGESQPLSVEAKYRVAKKASGTFLIIDPPVSSREWVNLLIGDYYRPEETEIRLPPFTDLLL